MRKFIRKYIVRNALYPFVVMFGWFYVKYQKYFRKKAMKVKYKNIVDGFSYLITTDKRVEEIAKERARICSECVHAKTISGNKPVTVMVNDKVHSYKVMKCNVCGCALAAKVRAMNDQCPINKWQSEPDTQS